MVELTSLTTGLVSSRRSASRCGCHAARCAGALAAKHPGEEVTRPASRSIVVRRTFKASRKRRIAAGAGVQVQEVNRLLKQFEQMQKMMKMMRGGNLGKMLKNMKGMLPGMR